MNNKVSVQWEKWERNERTHITKTLSLGVAISCSLCGLFFNKPSIGFGLGFALSVLTFIILSKIRSKR